MRNCGSGVVERPKWLMVDVTAVSYRKTGSGSEVGGWPAVSGGLLLRSFLHVSLNEHLVVWWKDTVPITFARAADFIFGILPL